ncbi:MAG: PmoA family protein, partial [Phycisphaerales bacterium]|nr:PmoA family protein [Phycisphaerales bacterium]
DHRDNPRHPTWWHARDYGLMAANPFGKADFEGTPRGEGKLVVAEGETVRFRYAVMMYSGRVEMDRLRADYDAWVAGGGAAPGDDVIRRE